MDSYIICIISSGVEVFFFISPILFNLCFCVYLFDFFFFFRVFNKKCNFDLTFPKTNFVLDFSKGFCLDSSITVSLLSSITSGFGSSITTGLGSSITTGLGCSITTGFGSSITTTGFGCCVKFCMLRSSTFSDALSLIFNFFFRVL